MLRQRCGWSNDCDILGIASEASEQGSRQFVTTTDYTPDSTPVASSSPVPKPTTTYHRRSCQVGQSAATAKMSGCVIQALLLGWAIPVAMPAWLTRGHRAGPRAPIANCPPHNPGWDSRLHLEPSFTWKSCSRSMTLPRTNFFYSSVIKQTSFNPRL